MSRRRAASLDPPRVGAEGVFHAWCLVIAVPEAAARQLMPRGLVPAPQALTPAGSHPVLLMLGRHTDVRPTFLPLPGAHYKEIAVIVPWLMWAGSDPGSAPLYSHLPKLYLSQWLWVIAGWLYALPKWRARIADTADRYSVAGWLSDDFLLSGDLRPYGEIVAPADFPEFVPLMPLFAQALRQRFTPLPWLASRMVFALERARMQATEVELKINAAFLPGLPPGTYKADGIDRGPMGGFRLDVPWSLSLPRFCGRGG